MVEYFILVAACTVSYMLGAGLASRGIVDSRESLPGGTAAHVALKGKLSRTLMR